MELALYAPGLGYYSAGAKKTRQGRGLRDGTRDFTPLRTDARAAGEAGAGGGFDEVLEVGAGSGALAATLLEELERSGRAPRNYLILELFGGSARAQPRHARARVPHLLERVAWLNRLPPVFSGVVLGNEVLDAMPANVVRISKRKSGRRRRRRAKRSPQLVLAPRFRRAARCRARAGAARGLSQRDPLAAQGFVRSLSGVLEKGVAFFVDYGFPQKEYYHPQRKDGTLMCHYRHHAHADPFFFPGLQDITSHVDFSAVARAAREGGLEVAGYTSQAQFLVNAGSPR